MPTLYLTRGLPASGKTTRARAWVAEDPEHRIRVNRDDLRDMGHGGRLGTGAQEAAMTAIQHAGIRALLGDARLDVVVDDTNLNPAHLRSLCHIAMTLSARYEVWDLTWVPLDSCIERDCVRAALGEPAVGEDVIRSMHARWLAPAPKG